MPFLLSLETREINQIYAFPSPGWFSVIIHIQRVVEGGLGPEYTPAYIRGLSKGSELIVQLEDDVWDIEYWTKGADYVKTTPGAQSPIWF